MNTAAHPERINIFLYVDDDDPTCQDYKKVVSNLATQYSPSAISLIFAPSVGVPKTASILFDATTADVFLTSNDDQIFIDPNWDTRLDIEIDKYPDNIFCTWFNDKWESNNFCTFPILSRQWIETLGYLQFPFFEHFFADAWIWMLEKAIERDQYIEDVIVEQRHWKTGKSEINAIYERHLTNENASRYARDRTIIDKFERYFHADVETLRKAMSQVY